MKQFNLYVAFVCMLALYISACSNTNQDNSSNPVSSTSLLKPPSQSPNANPVIAYRSQYKVSNTLNVPAIFVMDADGRNQTKVYTNYVKQGNNTIVQTPDFPAWKDNGSQLCFTLNNADLYTLSISLVNGLPVGSNPTKIGDGVAGGGSYKQGKWRPGANQIAIVWKRSGDPDKLHLISSTGGTPTVLYTSQNTDWFIEDDIAFNPSGAKILFSERQISTAQVFLKVLDVNTGQVLNSMNLSQFRSIAGLDWGKSSGTNNVAIQAIPLCDNTPIGFNQMHQVYTLDASIPTPALTHHLNDHGNISFRPDDLVITKSDAMSRGCGGNSCCVSHYYGIALYTLASQTYTTLISSASCKNPEWKR